MDEGGLDHSEDRDEEEDLELEAMLYSQIYYDQSEVGEIFKITEGKSAF